MLHLDAEGEGEERRHGVLLQYPVVTLSLEAVFGEVLRADVTVLCWLKVVPPHRRHPFSTNIWACQRKPVEIRFTI